MTDSPPPPDKQDRFGYPIAWAVEFRRDMLRQLQLESALRRDSYQWMHAAALAVDNKFDEAFAVMCALRPRSFRDYYNKGLLIHAMSGNDLDHISDLRVAKNLDSRKYEIHTAKLRDAPLTIIVSFPPLFGGMKLLYDIADHFIELGINVGIIQMRTAGKDHYRSRNDVAYISNHTELTRCLHENNSTRVIVGSWSTTCRRWLLRWGQSLDIPAGSLH